MYKLYLGKNKLVKAEFINSGLSGYYSVIYPDSSARKVSQIYFEQDYRELNQRELQLISMTDAEAQVSQISSSNTVLERPDPITLEQRVEQYYEALLVSDDQSSASKHWIELMLWAYHRGYTVDEISEARRTLVARNAPDITFVKSGQTLPISDLHHDPCNDHNYVRCWAPDIEYHMRCERCGHFQDQDN